MRRLALVANGLLASSFLWAATAEDFIKQAEKAWQQREQAGETEAAVKAWREAIKQDPSRVDLYIPLTRASSRVYRQTKSTQEKKLWATRAREYGALAAEKNPSKPEAYTRYAEALGQWAQANKGTTGLKMVKQAVESLNKAIALNPQEHFAHMLLAQFYEQAPRVISVGDKKKAMKHALLAVEYGPDYAINHKTLAKIYRARGKKAEAKQELEKALTLTPPPDAVPETKADQEDVREMLKDL